MFARIDCALVADLSSILPVLQQDDLSVEGTAWLVGYVQLFDKGPCYIAVISEA
jgi:hypothetical protein